jgi:hypothetical protein
LTKNTADKIAGGDSLLGLYQDVRMTIELPRDIETQLTEAAQSMGVSVSEYVGSLVVETNLRRAHVAEFRARHRGTVGIAECL